MILDVVDLLRPYFVWIVTALALAFWFWYSRRHNLHFTDLPRWARRDQSENELAERAAARLRYQKETGKSWRIAEHDPGVDPHYRKPGEQSR
jgi:hypothetical protein